MDTHHPEVREFSRVDAVALANLSQQSQTGQLLLLAERLCELDWLRAIAADLDRPFHLAQVGRVPWSAIQSSTQLLVLVVCGGHAGGALISSVRHQVPGATICAMSTSTETEVATALLHAGADLWLPTGMDRRLIGAFLAAQLRSKGRPAAGNTGLISFDRERGTLRIGNQLVSLRGAEFRLCEYLATHKERWIPASELRQNALGMGAFCSDSLVRVHVSNLRKALGTRQDWIQSRRRVGYRFSPRAEWLQ
jgi:DNA-binding response OmpR family regulator